MTRNLGQPEGELSAKLATEAVGFRFLTEAAEEVQSKNEMYRSFALVAADVAIQRKDKEGRFKYNPEQGLETVIAWATEAKQRVMELVFSQDRNRKNPATMSILERFFDEWIAALSSEEFKTQWMTLEGAFGEEEAKEMLEMNRPEIIEKMLSRFPFLEKKTAAFLFAKAQLDLEIRMHRIESVEAISDPLEQVSKAAELEMSRRDAMSGLEAARMGQYLSKVQWMMAAAVAAAIAGGAILHDVFEAPEGNPSHETAPKR